MYKVDQYSTRMFEEYLSKYGYFAVARMLLSFMLLGYYNARNYII